jgi:hypothetical protein
VEKLLRRAVRERGQSFKRVLNSAVRLGLMQRSKPKRFRQPTANMGQVAAGINIAKALMLAGELDDAELISKLKRRK